jgi:hypothetical protein
MNIDTLEGYARAVHRCLEKTFKVHLEFLEGTPEKLSKLCLIGPWFYRELYEALTPLYEKFCNQKSKKLLDDSIYKEFKPKIKRILKSLLLKEIIYKKKGDVLLYDDAIILNAKKDVLKIFFKGKPLSEDKKAYKSLPDQEKVYTLLIKATEDEFTSYLVKTVLMLKSWVNELTQENINLQSLVITNVCMLINKLIDILTLFENQSLFNFFHEEK